VSTAAFEHVLPWTEDEYLALGETPDRVELFDGSLLVSPAPTYRHQRLSHRLVNILEPAANRAGLEVFEAVNVRLRPGRIPIPDIVVTKPIDLDKLVGGAEAVELICEITSPSNAGTDKVLKLNHYAEAGIPWYLLVEPNPVVLLLFRLDGDRYVKHAEGRRGQPLHLDAPVVVDIDPAALER
jgi:Uma2 family endonuclease